jgi:HEPN domain-containing protein
MPLNSATPGSPESWLRYAQSDLAIALGGATTPEILYETLCFHAQQVAEKSIKAILVQQRTAFSCTHNLNTLITLIKTTEVRWDEQLDSASMLTIYAVAARYPGVLEEVTEDEYRQAIEIAELVFLWAKHLIEETQIANNPQTKS